MPTKVASLKLNGILSEPPPFAVPLSAWTDANNMLPRAGVMERIPFTNPGLPSTRTGPAMGIEVDSWPDFVNATAFPFFYGGGATGGVGSYAPLAHIVNAAFTTSTNVTPGAWSATVARHIWSAARLNASCYVLNTCREVPIYYDGLAAACAVLPNWIGAAYRALVIRSFREFLFALAPYNGANIEVDSVFWSGAAPALGPPATWIAAAANLAGNAFLQGPGGPIVDGLQLGDSFYIYKQRSVWKCERVDNNAVFAFRQVESAFGARGPNCIASDGKLHYALTEKDVVAWDGTSYQSLLTQKNRNKLDPQLFPISVYDYVYFDSLRSELYVATSTGATAASNVLIINTQTMEQSMRQCLGSGLSNSMFPRSVGSGVGGGQNVSCDQFNGAFVRSEAGADDNLGAALPSSLTRAGLDFGTPELVKKIRWVRPRISGSGSFSVEVAMTMAPDDALSYGTAVTFATASSDRAYFDQQVGRYASIRISCATATIWKCEGFDVGYEEVGLH